LLGAQASWGQQGSFRQPILFTDDAQSGVASHMSRSSQGQLAWTAAGRLALVYWNGPDGYIEGEVISNDVLEREWTPGGGWGAPAKVNHPTNAIEMARYPAMVVRPDGSLFVVWHDYRNAKDNNPDASMISNIEIYGGARPAGGSFAGPDLRLTQTNNGTNGDNGYLPKAVNLKDGRLLLTWYDFTWNLYQSEIAIKISDAGGAFASPAMDDVIHTESGDRAADDAGKSFAVPSAAVDGNGIVHLVWASFTIDAGTVQTSNLYYGRFDPASKTWLEKSRLRTQAGGYYDPAKLIADPVSGDVWLLFTDYGTAGNYEIFLQHRGKDAAAFDAPIRLTTNSGRQNYPDAAIDSQGLIHLVWVDNSTGKTLVHYQAYNPAGGQVVRQSDLTQGQGGNWARPAILVSPNNNLYVVWEDVDPTGLWFTTDLQVSRAGGWNLYE